MSRAFVKEQDYVAPQPERIASAHPNDVTARGLALIEAEVARWEAEHAAAVAVEDRHATARCARELRYWTARQASADVVPPPADGSEVRFGATVTLRRDDGREQTFQIVGEDEADPAQGSISHVSPMARALFGRRVGDVVRAGQSEAEIVAISVTAPPVAPAS
jgi:transcription elongation GreA/GreB family factor